MLSFKQLLHGTIFSLLLSSKLSIKNGVGVDVIVGLDVIVGVDVTVALEVKVNVGLTSGEEGACDDLLQLNRKNNAVSKTNTKVIFFIFSSL